MKRFPRLELADNPHAPMHLLCVVSINGIDVTAGSEQEVPVQDDKFCAEVPMPTPWSSQVNLESPLPDYPRPQLKREHWQSLNGIWGFKSRGYSLSLFIN